MVHFYDGNNLFPGISVPLANAFGIAFHADGENLRVTYLTSAGEGEILLQTMHVCGGNDTPATRVSPLVTLHVPDASIGVVSVSPS